MMLPERVQGLYKPLSIDFVTYSGAREERGRGGGQQVSQANYH
jgi:hypothetical protein